MDWYISLAMETLDGGGEILEADEKLFFCFYFILKNIKLNTSLKVKIA